MLKNSHDVMSELPMGFGMALVHNSGAMNYFTGLDEKKQKEILETAYSIESKQEMKNFVANLASFE